MAHQALYRRYRPRRFSEIKGQEHVVRAVRNAVRDGTVAHAYLFSGPRGTGKTTTARILAKAMNCEKPVDGEPCCECDSCLSVEAGTSLDVAELDAASNNGVDAMRDLVARVGLASGGKWKLYILDEVHMLSTAASNTLLKTLEEPPAHVIFVLATTDPQKVLATIRSRTQHLEFRLLPAKVLEEHLRWVIADAGLDVTDEAIELAIRRGAGSARDSLSALDQIVAAGGLVDDRDAVDEIVEALCEHDTGRALVGVAAATDAGLDPRHLAESLLGHLRDAFLSLMARDLVALPDRTAERVADQARRLGAPATVRALDALGEAIVAMREAPDPRVLVEVALVRLTRPELDTTPAALVERLERLERAQRTGDAPAAVAREVVASDPPPAPPATPRAPRSGPPPVPPAPPVPRAQAAAPAPQPSAPPSAATAPASELPSRDELTMAWADHVIGQLRPAVKARYLAGRFVGVDQSAAHFALPNQAHLEQCEPRKADVEAALAAHFGRPVPLRLVVDDPAATPAPSPADPAPATPVAAVEEEHVDVHELEDAPAAATGIDRLAEAFPGAEVVEE